MSIKRSWIMPCGLAIALSLAVSVSAQRRRPAEGSRNDPSNKTADSAQKHSDSTKKDPVALRPYKDVITPDMQAQTGFFTIYRKDSKFYFEIPVSLYGREILFVNRVAKAAADMRNGSSGYAGDQIGSRCIVLKWGLPVNCFFAGSPSLNIRMTVRGRCSRLCRKTMCRLSRWLSR